jgi:hypothetical protein
MSQTNRLTGKELKRLYELLFVKATVEQQKLVLKELKSKVNPCCQSCGEVFDNPDYLSNAGLCPDCEIAKHEVM